MLPTSSSSSRSGQVLSLNLKNVLKNNDLLRHSNYYTPNYLIFIELLFHKVNYSCIFRQ